MRVNVLSLAPRAVLAVTGDIGALTLADPSDPDAFAFEISGAPKKLREAVVRSGHRATVWVLRFPGLVSNRQAKVSVPVSGAVWAAGSILSWPAAVNDLTPTAA